MQIGHAFHAVSVLTFFFLIYSHQDSHDLQISKIEIFLVFFFFFPCAMLLS